MESTSIEAGDSPASVGVRRRRGDGHAGIEALFSRHYVPLCRLAFVILGNAASAEEIVMDALLKTFGGWSRIRDQDRAEIYLRRTVVNLCRSKIRRAAVEERVHAALLLRREIGASGSDGDRTETSWVVWTAVRALPERQRTTVVLRYYADLPEAEIADLMECSTGTVKSQLAKARAKLETRLGDLGLRGDE